jgi:hypothetical protein
VLCALVGIVKKCLKQHARCNSENQFSSCVMTYLFPMFGMYTKHNGDGTSKDDFSFGTTLRTKRVEQALFQVTHIPELVTTDPRKRRHSACSKATATYLKQREIGTVSQQV